MKTYKGMTRGELMKKVIDARVEQCRKQNFKKFGNNDFPRKNEILTNGTNSTKHILWKAKNTLGFLSFMNMNCIA